MFIDKKLKMMYNKYIRKTKGFDDYDKLEKWGKILRDIVE